MNKEERAIHAKREIADVFSLLTSDKIDSIIEGTKQYEDNCKECLGDSIDGLLIIERKRRGAITLLHNADRAGHDAADAVYDAVIREMRAKEDELAETLFNYREELLKKD